MRRLAFPTVLAAAALAACHTGTQLVSQCTSDDQCAPNFHCGTSGAYVGFCLCSNDQACPQDAGPAFCNAAGQCQAKVGCQNDQDCEAPSYCDVSLGLCVPSPQCGSDVDCPIGYVCAGGQCVAGCHSDGDCAVDVPCVCSSGAECQCPPADAGVEDPAVYDRSDCEIGTCQPGTCAGDTSLCPYNETCTSGTGADAGSVCLADPRMGVLCQPCAAGSAFGQACSPSQGGVANFCLIDLFNDDLFCGVDCSHGQSCPSGYGCDDIIILTQSPCQQDADCHPSSIACTNDGGLADGGTGCPSEDSRCAGPGNPGSCAGYCVVNEGSTQGYCTCVTDSDCPKDVCNVTTRQCSVSLQPCDPSQANACQGYISCVDFGGQRGCFIGRNCAPGQGLHCPLTQQQ